MRRDWMSPKRSRVSLKQLDRALQKLKQGLSPQQVASCCAECELAVRMILSVTTASSDEIFRSERRPHN